MSRSRKLIQTGIEDINSCTRKKHFPSPVILSTRIVCKLAPQSYVSGLVTLHYKTEKDFSLSTSYGFVLCHFNNIKLH